MILLIAWHMVHLLCQIRTVPTYFRYLGDCLARSFKGMFCKEHLTPQEQLELQVVEAVRNKTAKRKLNFMANVCFVALLANYVTNASCHGCWHGWVPAVIGSPMIVVLRICRLANARGLTLIHVHVIATIVYLHIVYPKYTISRWGIECCVRAYVALLASDLTQTFFLNSICGLCVTLSYDLRFDVSKGVLMMAGFETCAVITVWLTAYGLHQSAQFMLTDEFLQARASQQNEAVVHRLLAGMCNAVVRLDHDFRIKERAPRLMTLLSLHHASAKGLEGVPFQDLIIDDSDKSAFCTRLSDASTFAALLEAGDKETAQDQTSSACTLPSTLKDACDSHMRVQLFHTTFKDVDNSCHYIVGVREQNPEEQGVQRVPVGVGCVSGDQAAALDAETCEASLEPPSQNPTEMLLSDLTFPSSASPTWDASVWVDVYSSRLTVRCCSVGFACLSDPSQPCNEFLMWICRDQRQEFLEWLQTSVNASVWGDRVGIFEGLILQPPHLEHFHIAVRVLARIAVEDPSQSEGFDCQHLFAAERIWRIDLGSMGLVQSRPNMRVSL